MDVNEDYSKLARKYKRKMFWTFLRLAFKTLFERVMIVAERIDKPRFIGINNGKRDHVKVLSIIILAKKAIGNKEYNYEDISILKDFGEIDPSVKVKGGDKKIKK